MLTARFAASVRPNQHMKPGKGLADVLQTAKIPGLDPRDHGTSSTRPSAICGFAEAGDRKHHAFADRGRFRRNVVGHAQ